MGTAERREREKQQRRNDILDAAEKVFFQKGLNVATMDEIAEEAELSKGTLYLYFKSKEDLYFGITQRALIQLKKIFSEAVKTAEKGIDKVTAIGDAYYKFAQENADNFNSILHYEASQLSLTLDDSIMEQCHILGKQVLEVLAGAIHTGIEDGTIRDDIDPIQIAFLLQGQSTGIIQLIARENKHIQKYEHFQAEELYSKFTDFVVNALTPKK